MQKNILTILLLTFSFLAYGRIGLADWSCKTPGGSEINNFTDYTLYLQNNTQLDGIDRWYFYKDCIIGRLRDVNYDTTGYFVVNELNFQIDTFKTKSEWTFFLSQHKLLPAVWTRWYENDWTFFDNGIAWWFILAPYISIPLTIIYLFFLFEAIKKDKFSFKRPYTIIFTFITAGVFFSWLLEQFPQSI